MRKISAILAFAVLAVPLAAVEVTNEQVEVDYPSGADYNMSVQRYFGYPYYWYMYYQGEGEDSIWARRATSGQGTYTNPTRITPVSSNHAFAGNVCSGNDVNVWGLGGHIYDSYPNHEVILSLNHACNIDRYQNRFFYVAAQGLTRTSGNTAIPFLDTSGADYQIWNPQIFSVYNGTSYYDGGVFGFFFVFDLNPGNGIPEWGTGYGFHDMDAGSTTIHVQDGSWYTVYGPGYDWPASGKPFKHHGGLQGLVVDAELKTLNGAGSEPKGRALLMTTTPFPAGNCTDDAKLVQIKFDTTTFRYHSVDQVVETYTDFAILSSCTGDRICINDVARSHAGGGLAYQDIIFWAEDDRDGAGACNYTYRILSGDTD
jgi:hypothetical protein